MTSEALDMKKQVSTAERKADTPVQKIRVKLQPLTVQLSEIGPEDLMIFVGYRF